MQNLLNQIKKLYLKFKLFIWKIMNTTVSFYTFDSDCLSIDVEQISTIILGYFEPVEFDINGSPIKFQEVIIVLYTNGTRQSFPATPKNLETANRVMKRLKLKI